MAKEIERKFLVADGSWRDLVEAEIRIRQFYLAAGPARTVRIRISDGSSAVLTLKFSGKGRGRDEFEYPGLPGGGRGDAGFRARPRDREDTLPCSSPGGYLYEVDVFGGDLAGLVIVELETPDDVLADQLPFVAGSRGYA